MPQNYDFKGPLSALEPHQSNDVLESFFYPEDLTTVTGHYMRFDCNIFEDSRFQQGIKGDFGSPKDAGREIIRDPGKILGGLILIPGGSMLPAAIQNIIRNQRPGTTSAALNYLNALPEGGTFYNSFPGLRGIGHKKTINHIYMYTPDTLVFDYQNKWDTISLREQFGLLADGISMANDMNNGKWGAAATTGIAQGLKAMGIGDAVAMKNIVTAMRGFPVNPMTETIFKETRPRDFKFQFKMYPQTPKESEQIFNIVEQFSFHAAPEYAASEIGGYLIMPSVFDIHFMLLIRDVNGNAIEIENPWIRRISTCGLTNISVDYTGSDGAWMAMEDGSPRSLSLSLEFTELEIMSKDRIKRGF